MKRILSMLLALVLSVGILSAIPMSASAATNGRTGSSSYCTVKISQSLINKKGKQYATVKLKTYDGTGWYNTGAKVRITLRDGNGRYITSWVGKGGDTLKLGDDHRTYRIYVDYYQAPVSNSFFSRVFTAGNNFTNMGGSYKWGISNAKNCTVS